MTVKTEIANIARMIIGGKDKPMRIRQTVTEEHNQRQHQPMKPMHATVVRNQDISKYNVQTNRRVT